MEVRGDSSTGRSDSLHVTALPKPRWSLEHISTASSDPQGAWESSGVPKTHKFCTLALPKTLMPVNAPASNRS